MVTIAAYPIVARVGRWRRALPWLVLAGVVAAPAGWMISDRLEARNDFCTSCHLAADASNGPHAGTPLHRAIRRDFDARPPLSLASAHAAAGVEGRPDPAFRCIDCHQGTGALGRARVKALAAKDAFFYLLGWFEEPRSMSHPLQDSDCRKCHSGFEEPSSEAEGATPRFHALPVHNAKLGVGCVECHQSHERGGEEASHFLRADALRTQCARCHSEFN